VIAYDGEAAPAYSMASFTPSIVPGCRTPHFWLGDGRSLYDSLSAGYTLLRTDRTVNVDALLAAARQRGVPLAVLDISPEEAGPVYNRALVISRPDQHVAWRGNAVPDDALSLIDRLRGAAAPA
jgi:hypothetical protein